MFLDVAITGKLFNPPPLDTEAWTMNKTAAFSWRSAYLVWSRPILQNFQDISHDNCVQIQLELTKFWGLVEKNGVKSVQTQIAIKTPLFPKGLWGTGQWIDCVSTDVTFSWGLVRQQAVCVCVSCWFTWCASVGWWSTERNVGRWGK